jgi:hypothetical protein
MRLNRLRRFVEDEAVRFQFSDEEQISMLNTLTKALDKKLLNSKSVVTYDTDQQKILEIKGFVFHRQADGTIVFQFVERKTGTMRRKASTEPKQSPPTTPQE